jgi:hypothetical protein
MTKPSDKISSMSEAWTPPLPAGDGESAIKKAHFFSAALWPWDFQFATINQQLQLGFRKILHRGIWRFQTRSDHLGTAVTKKFIRNKPHHT